MAYLRLVGELALAHQKISILAGVTQRLRLLSGPQQPNFGRGNDERRTGSASLATSRREWAELISDQADHLVVLHRSDRWLRHRRHRLRSALPCQGVGPFAGRARTGVQCEP